MQIKETKDILLSDLSNMDLTALARRQLERMDMGLADETDLNVKIKEVAVRAGIEKLEAITQILVDRLK